MQPFHGLVKTFTAFSSSFLDHISIPPKIHTGLQRSVNTTFGHRRIKLKGSVVWNNLPNYINNIGSINKFKSELNCICNKTGHRNSCYISRESKTTRNVLWSRVCVSVCVSVRGRMPTLLHGPGCNLGEW